MHIVPNTLCTQCMLCPMHVDCAHYILCPLHFKLSLVHRYSNSHPGANPNSGQLTWRNSLGLQAGSNKYLVFTIASQFLSPTNKCPSSKISGSQPKLLSTRPNRRIYLIWLVWDKFLFRLVTIRPFCFQVVSCGANAVFSLPSWRQVQAGPRLWPRSGLRHQIINCWA